MILVKDLQALRRRATGFVGPWRAVDCGVFDDQRAVVARAANPEAAAYLADIHNLFLPLANGWLMARKQLRDRKLLDDLIRKDALQ